MGYHKYVVLCDPILPFRLTGGLAGYERIKFGGIPHKDDVLCITVLRQYYEVTIAVLWFRAQNKKMLDALIFYLQQLIHP